MEDLRWLGKKQSRAVLKATNKLLLNDPLAKTKNMKDLRPNPLAERELRLLGKFRVLFNVDTESEIVTLMVVGEKRGNALWVRGEEFTAHESDSVE